MKSISIAIFILLLFSSLHSQHFQYSFHNESSFFSLSGSSEIESAPFTKFLFSSTYTFDSSNAIDLRVGYQYIKNNRGYTGPEIGLYYHRALLGHLYGFSGIKIHPGLFYDERSHTVPLAAAGLGFIVDKLIGLEIIYNKTIVERYYGEGKIYYEINLGITIRLSK